MKDGATKNEFAAATERLFARRRFGMQPGLEVSRALLARLGDPQNALATVHIAGTNGKGALAAMLSAVLSAAGYRVGRFTSPHLLRFNERFVIDELPVEDAVLGEAVKRVEAAAVDMASSGLPEPTFFECATAIAFLMFQEAGLRLAIMETGLGGRLDATNVVTPLMAVITRIGMDHMQWLGETIEQIAAEKAGIVKPGRPVLAGAMPETALAVVQSAAERVNAPFRQAGDFVSVQVVNADFEGQRLRIATESQSFGTVRLPLAGHFQVENVATAVAACEWLSELLPEPIAPEALRDGLARVFWPGRFQCVRRNPPVVIDGAHNADGARALREALRHTVGKRDVGLIVGMCADKDAYAVLRILAPAVRRAWAVPTPSPRACAPEHLARLLRQLSVPVAVNSFDAAVEAGLAWCAEEERLLLVAGSLFLAGQALAHFGAPGSGAHPDPNESLTPVVPAPSQV